MDDPNSGGILNWPRGQLAPTIPGDSCGASQGHLAPGAGCRTGDRRRELQPAAPEAGL